MTKQTKTKLVFYSLVFILLAGLSQIKIDFKSSRVASAGEVPTLDKYAYQANQLEDHRANLIESIVPQDKASTNESLNQDPVIITSESSQLNQSENEEADLETFTVSRVIDGDTIELGNGQRVRYIGVDSPEITKGKNECYGQQAKSFNQKLVTGKQIILKKDVSETDRYGRLLRYVYIGDLFINEELVKNGYAKAATFPPDVAWAVKFNQLQEQARILNLGLWADCQGTLDQNQSTVPQTNRTECPADKPIKGNAQSMIYHLPSAKYYNATKPEDCFSTEAEAVKAGYRKSKI